MAAGNRVFIPQLVRFQCLQFGQFRAVLGLVGSGTCNGSCNDSTETDLIINTRMIVRNLRMARQMSHSEILIPVLDIYLKNAPLLVVAANVSVSVS